MVRALVPRTLLTADSVSIEHAASDVDVAYDPVGSNGIWRRVPADGPRWRGAVESNYDRGDGRIVLKPLRVG